MCSGIPIARVQMEILEEQSRAYQADRNKQQKEKYAEEPLPSWVIEGLPNNEAE